MEVATLDESVLKRFTQLVIEGNTLRGIREVIEFPLPVDDVPLIRLMLQIIDNKEVTQHE